MKAIDYEAFRKKSILAMTNAILQGDYECAKAIKEFIEVLEKEEKVEAEPVRHGQWRYDRPNAIFTCSECLMMYRDNPNYCPRCGAKMDGEQHDK